jgi:drug/metabolite transporter (DMT)-like permease
MLWISIVAMAFYALEIAITDWKLAEISPRLLTFFYSLGVAIFSLGSIIFAKEAPALPDFKQSIFVALMVLASFIAASAHFHALASGTGAIKLTMVYMLLPVAAAFYMFIFKHEFPDSRIILAWVLSVVALYLLSTAKTSA